ncbi:unnamed protein product [Moneuplotes crassus]|uniref:Shikimate dehydrogenase substrate binding N-terminal domain-containing protein n=1 Tax=Euplotes crassus TaxID=5936 RepID=A0AAD1X3M8_EUPCR|nr:unnamed protein product [Moneuplotes crassus]
METIGNKNNEEYKETKTITEDECLLVLPESKEILESLETQYHAIEFRVDLFLDKLCRKWTQKDYIPNTLVRSYIGQDIPSSQVESEEILSENLEFYKDCISRAIGVMKTLVDTPIIYTVRTVQDGGKIDTHQGFQLYNELTKYGAEQMACDFIDIEFQFRENMQGITNILKSCTDSLVIMSKHYTSHNEKRKFEEHHVTGQVSQVVKYPKESITEYNQLAFSLKVYEKSFDIIKIVSSFSNLDDFNTVSCIFKDLKFSQPKIQINLGEKMKVTRVLNKYLLPVSCLEISKSSTAPGQMSLKEVIEARDSLCLNDSERYYYLFGSPVTYSPSPTFHNTVFSCLGIKAEYKIFNTDCTDSSVYMIEKECTMGCSITIPLKRTLFERYKEYASEDALYIQSINTIVKHDGHFKVYNTDWMAIYSLINQKLPNVTERTNKALIIGMGGTSLAAAYAVLKLGMTPILYSRKSNIDKNIQFMKELWKKNDTPQYCHELELFQKANDFSKFKSLIEFGDKEGLDLLAEGMIETSESGVDAIISCIPGVSGFTIPAEVEDILLRKDRNVIVYDSSYIPKETELLKQAKAKNCQIVTGLEMLISQAWLQAKLFTGKEKFDEKVIQAVEEEVYKYYDSLSV